MLLCLDGQDPGEMIRVDKNSGTRPYRSGGDEAQTCERWRGHEEGVGAGGVHCSLVTRRHVCAHRLSPNVNLWRVVVPRGGAEPPQPPPAGPEAFWGYAPPWPPGPPHHQQQQQPIHPQPQRPHKRAHSESGDDQDDVFSEESSKDQCSSPGDADSCQMLSRKKRRGIIEKRRRDRINTSLLELRRLVPSAFEKQGSAKLEKAEILQMTVDHLKTLHAKGVDNNSYDPSKVAMDYHSIGFRECAAEVARYLVTVEGLDSQDPLRLRLMSHLQCFASQRELSKPWPVDGGAHPSAKTWADTSGSSSSANNSSFECDGPVLTPLTPAPPPPYHYPQHHYSQEYPPTSSHQKPYRPWGGTEMAY